MNPNARNALVLGLLGLAPLAGVLLMTRRGLSLGDDDEPRYRVFTRTWWRYNPAWPGGREPRAGPQSYRGHPKNLTWDEAFQYCKQWSATHPPGLLSRKAEFEQM